MSARDAVLYSNPYTAGPTAINDVFLSSSPGVAPDPANLSDKERFDDYSTDDLDRFKQTGTASASKLSGPIYRKGQSFFNQQGEDITGAFNEFQAFSARDTKVKKAHTEYVQAKLGSPGREQTILGGNQKPETILGGANF